MRERESKRGREVSLPFVISFHLPLHFIEGGRWPRRWWSLGHAGGNFGLIGFLVAPRHALCSRLRVSGCRSVALPPVVPCCAVMCYAVLCISVLWVSCRSLVEWSGWLGPPISHGAIPVRAICVGNPASFVPEVEMSVGQLSLSLRFSSMKIMTEV